MTERSTREVFDDHLWQSQYGDIDTDLGRNYVPDVVILSGFGRFHGHEGVRAANRLLSQQLPRGRFQYRTQEAHGEIAFLEWSAEANGARVQDGVDTYLICSSRIQVQTIHYTVVLGNGKETDMSAGNQQLMERCIDQCYEVAKLASQCAHQCITGGQVDHMARCISLCLDAATITTACAEMMSRNSQFAAQVCGVCADACDACASECEKYDGDIMKQCAEACRRCAETCRQMAA